MTVGLWKVDEATRYGQLRGEVRRYKRERIISAIVMVGLLALVILFVSWVLSLGVV